MAPSTAAITPRGSRLSAHLDALRALAALAVFAGHLRGHLFVPWTPALRPQTWVRAVHFASGFGHEAVMVFFVLSGYLLGGAVIRDCRAGTWSWRRYLGARLTRLWLVLLPALILGAIADGAGLALGTRLHASLLTPDRFSVKTWLANLFFLQEIRTPEFGSNAPLWSLSYELWYYLAFPCLVGAVLAKGWRARSANALAVGAILFFVGGRIAAWFPMWLAGAALWLLPRPSARAGGALAMGASLGLAGALLRSGTHDSLRGTFLGDLPIALLVAALLAGLRADARPAPVGYARITAAWAGWSYTLYLVNFPVLLLIDGLLFPSDDQRWPLTPGCALAGLSIGAAVLAYAYLVSRLTEARTGAVRRWLLGRLEHERVP